MQFRFIACLSLATLSTGFGCAFHGQGKGDATQGMGRRVMMNVRDFGAVADGKAKDTGAVQKAIDACTAAGGGEVLVPAGDYLVGTIVLKSGVILRLEKGTVLHGSADLADYPITDVRFEGAVTKGHEALIYAENAEHIGVVGPGKLEGCEHFATYRNPRAPTMGEFVHCKDIRLEDFSSTYQRMWNYHFLYCDDLKAKNLNIRSAPTAISDGMDVESTTHVRIDHCDIDTGDDCIALKSGKGVAALQINKPTADVVVTDCTLGSHFAGIAVGTEMSGGVKDVRVERCKFTHGANAIYIKSRTGRGGTIENFVATDLDVQTSTFLGINLLNKGTAGTDLVPGTEGIPAARKIEIGNVRVKCGTLVDGAHVGSEKPLEGLVLSNITGECKKGISLQNMVDVEIKGVQVTGAADPLIRIDHVKGMGLDGAVEFTAPPTLIKPPTTRGGPTTSAPAEAP